MSIAEIIERVACYTRNDADHISPSVDEDDELLVPEEYQELLILSAAARYIELRK